MALLKRKRSGLSDPMSVVTNFVNACNRHDAEGVSACLHPDFDSIQPMYPSRNFRGADQVRRNWQAIFDAEPGFRLTVLRSAAAADTVWLELHGAGRDAEVAGVFVMGVQGDRIRWARIYSALVEGAPGVGDSEPAPPPAGLREVPPLPDGASRQDAASAAVAADAGTVDEDIIAPVVDIDGNGRSFRRRTRRKGGDAPGEPVAPVPAPSDRAVEAAEDPVIEEAAAALATVPAPDHEPEAPPVSPVDSIDAENLVDAETLVEPDRPDEAVAAPESGPLGSDYDLERTMAVEAVAAPAEEAPDPDGPDSDVLVETMVTVESAGPEPPASPELPAGPDFEVAVVAVEPEPAAGAEEPADFGLPVDWGKAADPPDAATTPAPPADDPLPDGPGDGPGRDTPKLPGPD